MPTYSYGSPAEMKARYDALTALIHRARARNDHIEDRAIAAEREALEPLVYPGDGSPGTDQRGHQVG